VHRGQPHASLAARSAELGSEPGRKAVRLGAQRCDFDERVEIVEVARLLGCVLEAVEGGHRIVEAEAADSPAGRRPVSDAVADAHEALEIDDELLHLVGVAPRQPAGEALKRGDGTLLGHPADERR
jgi:hypothetical protein